MIAKNLEDVREKIAHAARAAGRTENEISLVAVSKTKPLTMIREAFGAGQVIFGENYVQEAVEKATAFPEAEWHLIGSLQTNKVKFLENHFALIHSVDREKLALELQKLALKMQKPQDILLQVRIGDEVTKQGVIMDEAWALIESIGQLSHLRLRGIMSLPPPSEDERTARGYFSSLRENMETWKARLPRAWGDSFDVLSMGTSGDFEWAIQEGATMVRVGTAIFGSRS